MSIEIQTEQYISTVIKNIHNNLADNFTFSPETRDLTAYESQLLQEIDQHSIQYKSLTGILAIDSYVKYIIDMLIKSQPILQIIAILFNDVSIIEQSYDKLQQQSMDKHLQQTWIHLAKLAQISHGLFPNSPYVNVHRQFIEGYDLDITQTIYTNLHHRNQSLKAKLKQNDRQILELQLKLTKLIQQNDDFDNTIDSSAKIFELKQSLICKERQIEKMNQEFNFEIQKYNTVFQVMKRQNEQLRRGKNMDLYGMIAMMEGEISKLKQQRERDQIVIGQLKERIMYPSSQLKRSSSYSRLYY